MNLLEDPYTSNQPKRLKFDHGKQRHEESIDAVHHVLGMCGPRALIEWKCWLQNKYWHQ